MPPEKVAVLVITGLIATLLSMTLMKSPQRELPPDAPASWSGTGDTSWEKKDLRGFTYQDLVDGKAATSLTPRDGEGPPASKPETAAAPRTPLDHVIRKGDTLEEISRRHYGSVRYVKVLLAANPGLDPRRLLPGRRIQIPVLPEAQEAEPSRDDVEVPAAHGEVWYKVARGDRLESIAKVHYGRRSAWPVIYKANVERLSDPHRLKVGQRLLIPEQP